MDPLTAKFLHSLAAVAALVFVVWTIDALARPRKREDDMQTQTGQLKVGQAIEVFAGPHSGIVGEVMELTVDADNGKRKLLVRSQLGEWVEVDREDAEAI